PVTVVLKENVKSLDGVTVIAYGRRNTQELVGAVSSIKADQLKDAPAPSLQSLLQGQMSGLSVTNQSGSPGGGGTRINIRGISSLNDQGINDGSPLFVVDGVPLSKVSAESTGGINALAGLDPSTIESVEVLKDAASASLYGSRSGNGVVLITTKKGKSGKAEFGLNFSQSISFLPSTPLQMRGHGERRVHNILAQHQRIGHNDYTTNRYILPRRYGESYGWEPTLDGAYDYFWGNGNVLTKDNQPPASAQDSLNAFYNNDTNWWKYIFQVGRVTSGDFYASGGNDNVRYLVSTGLYDERGIQINSGFKRLSFLSNLDLRLTPKVNAFTRLNLAYNKQQAISGSNIQGLDVDPKETPTVYPGRGSIAEQLTLQKIRDVRARNGMFNARLSVGIDYSPIAGLKFATSASGDAYFSNNHVFRPSYLNSNNLSSVEASRSMVAMIQWENILSYRFNLRDRHNFDLMAGMTTTYDLMENIKGKAAGGPTNKIYEIGDGWPQGRNVEGRDEYLQRVTTDRQEQIMLSYLGRVAYNFDKRYMLEASLRYDGSSVFGRDVRWAAFPSLGAAWAFSKEQFMKDFWFLSFGKIRASWGKSGQKFQEAYLAHGLMEESNSFLGQPGLQPSAMANSHLTWEKSDQYDLGLDLDLFNYRFKVKVDYYYKHSYDLLMQVPTPGNFFISKTTWTNASAISNEGLELDLSADLMRRKDFSWNLRFNIARNWNRFLASYDGKDLGDKVLGRPIYGIYTYKDEGLVQDESAIPYYYDQTGLRVPLSFGSLAYPLRVGGRKIKDQNGDGYINSEDIYYAGSALPKAYGGITNTFTYKRLALNVLLTYTIDQRMMNMVKNGAFLFNKKFGVVMNDFSRATFWQNPGDKTEYPSLEFADDGYTGQFDGDIDTNIERVSYLRLKQLSLSYSLPETWTKRLRMKDVRIYFAGENLLLLTNYSGLDPEIVDPATGKDTGRMYPLNRKLTLGLNLKF
ncbi:MAG: SusC/RagA family TonB-linked outer membrane protein, partial [Porphyromonas pasteri]